MKKLLLSLVLLLTACGAPPAPTTAPTMTLAEAQARSAQMLAAGTRPDPKEMYDVLHVLPPIRHDIATFAAPGVHPYADTGCVQYPLMLTYQGPMTGWTYAWNQTVVPYRSYVAASGTLPMMYFTPQVYFQNWSGEPGAGGSLYDYPCWDETPASWNSPDPSLYSGQYNFRDIRYMFTSNFGTSYAAVWLHVWNNIANFYGGPGEECWIQYAYPDYPDWRQVDCSWYYLDGGRSF